MVLVDVDIAQEIDDIWVQKGMGTAGTDFQYDVTGVSNASIYFDRFDSVEYNASKGFFLFKGITIPAGSIIDDATLNLKGILNTTSTQILTLTVGALNNSAPVFPVVNNTNLASSQGLWNSSLVAPKVTTTIPTTVTAPTTVGVNVQSIVQELVNTFNYIDDNMMFRLERADPVSYVSAQGVQVYFFDQNQDITSTAELTINYTFSGVQFNVGAILSGLVVSTLELETPTPPDPMDITLLQFETPFVTGEGCGGTFCEDFDQYGVAKLPIFRDDFTTYSDQAEADASWVSSDVAILRANPSTDKLDFTIPSSILKDDAIIHDLGENFVSDTKWTLRFKLDITAFSGNTTTSGENIGIVLSDSDETFGVPDNQNWIGMLIASAQQITDTYVIYGRESSNVRRENVSGDFTHTVGVEILYMEIKRISRTEIQGNIYSDEKYTDLIESITLTRPDITGLRYLKVTYRSIAVANTVLTGTVEDIVFWNDEAEGAVTFQDDFTSYADQTEADASWATTDTKVRVDVTNDAIAGTFVADGTNDATAKDILGGTVSDTNWVLRYKISFQTVDDGGNTQNKGIYIGLFDEDQTSSTFNNQNGIFQMWLLDSTRAELRLARTINDQPEDNINTDKTIDNIITVSTQFIELKRIGSDSYEMSTYSDAEYRNLVNREVGDLPLSGVTNLRYLKIMNQVTQNGAGELVATIEDIEFYDGVSVAKTPVKTKIADFEDSFWEDNWTDTGAQHSVNTSTRVIDWDSDNEGGVSQTTFDLETLFPDGVNQDKWGLRFKFTFGGTINGLGASTQFAVFLTDAVAGTSSEAGQDHATWKVQAGVGTTSFTGHVDDASQIFTGQNVGLGIDLVLEGETGYGEMTRNGNLFTWAVYSDPDFTQLLGNGKLSVNETVDTVAVRYLKIGKRDLVASVATFNGTVDNIQFWNGSLPTEHGSKWVEVNIV